MSKTESEMQVPPPDHLSERSKDLWSRLLPRCKSLGRKTMLAEALAALDRLNEIRVALEKEGLTTKNEKTGMVHVNPLLKAEKDARTLFSRLWGQLSFQWCMSIDGRSD
jgi:phage terminase small subunit